VYERIMAKCQTWNESCRPIFVSDDRPDLAKWPAIAQHATSGMEDAKRIAVAGYGQVLEDGPDVCDSEGDSEHSDYGEDWGYSEMYTPDTLGPDGKRPTGGHIYISRPNKRTP
jgi:hypothetical protein